MKRQTNHKKGMDPTDLQEYGQGRLVRYADSFKELADLIAGEFDVPYEDENDALEVVADPQLKVMRLEQDKSRKLISEQLQEMAQIMDLAAKETYRTIPLGERRFRILYRLFRQENIELKNLFRIENEDGHATIGVVIRAKGRECITLDDVAGLVSVALNNRFLPKKEGPIFVGRDFNLYHFYEEPAFVYMTGLAKAVKESEKVSGDSVSFCESICGHMIALLSDGTGSGSVANEDSEHILHLMQKLLEAGFTKEKAIHMINDSLLLKNNDQYMPTLDLCDLDLYTGNIELLKIGAACTYIKREHMMDRISAGSLPLGASTDPDIDVIHRELMDGDYVIMLSDGVLEAVSRGSYEELFPEFLGRLVCQNPSEMASQILNYCIRECKGQIKDDMTVLVIGIWENTM